MKKIKIIKGDFSGETWLLEKDSIESGFYNLRQIPISEVIELTKIKVSSKEHIVKFSLSDGKSFTSSMSEKTYDSFYKLFSKSGNQPKNQTLPVVKKSKSNVAIVGATIVLIVGFLSIGEPEKKLNTAEQAKLCKAYIGELFGKPVSSINNYKNSKGLVYVKYTRALDNTKWNYVCDVSEGTMVWAGWLKGQQTWGRWRKEDEVRLNYDSASSRIAFTISSTGNKVSVKL